METKHTPGEWGYFEGQSPNRRIYIAAKDQQGRWTAPLAELLRVNEWSPATEKANAALISAAPELLAACKVTIAAIPRCAPNNRVCTCAKCGAINALRAAIAKAEGEEA